MSAEEIAKVVADLRAGRCRTPKGSENLAPMVRRMLVDGPAPKVVDATSIHRSMLDGRTIDLYGDFSTVVPPWEVTAVGYVNEKGLVVVNWVSRLDWDSPDGWGTPDIPAEGPIAETADWDRVRWEALGLMFVGGRVRDPETDQMLTVNAGGPLFGWRWAIYDDGSAADLRWVHIVEEMPVEQFDMAHVVTLAAMNFLNCRNVTLVEPRRPNAERKRIARTGVAVHEINVYPIGKRSTGPARPAGQGTPLTSVRGHFGHYGDCCPRQHEPHGLLFGKLEGKFWIPQHARGSAEEGVVTEQRFNLRAKVGA